MSQQNSESLSEVENQSARMNPPPQQQNGNQPSLMQRLGEMQFLKLSRKNIIKGIFLVIIIAATFWMASSLLHETLVRDRVPMKFGRSSNQVQQIAAPDDIGYRSFYYYNLMVQIAKENVKNKKSFTDADLGQQQFTDINFWELYGLFKVVKAIQLANGYDDLSKKNDTDNTTDEIKYDEVDNLTEPVNLTSLFNKPADQGQCASCYSFPIAATIEYQITKKTGKKVKLSEQELIDCSNPDPNANGCAFGNMTRGFEYARDIGLVAQKSYPYRSQSGHSYECNKKILDDANATKYPISSFRSLPSGNCKAIQYELVMGNAVASMINTGQMSEIKNYSERKFFVIEAYRNCLKSNPNHAVAIVGQTQNQDWIVRNSWGESWGNKGYFIIKKGNTCGICNHAVVPEL